MDRLVYVLYFSVAYIPSCVRIQLAVAAASTKSIETNCNCHLSYPRDFFVLATTINIVDDGVGCAVEWAEMRLECEPKCGRQRELVRVGRPRPSGAPARALHKAAPPLFASATPPQFFAITHAFFIAACIGS